ncbi:hypothetical protein SBOR_7575 [Sclerotinia borealis F-4128]|uniref:Uncharacterized protein n=1 Tax=Sclerotinia borealis (strain F-4128) TaxID=1432307 RepID=W9CBU6_SCLBF|nr:hypothetical protein SBOR_7575 [Sclerotinia borealis F-4128]
MVLISRLLHSQFIVKVPKPTISFEVILACRSLEKADKAKLELEQTLAVDVNEKANALQRLDVMLLNAGIMTKEYRVAEDNESTITVNVISTFLMAFSLMSKLKETANTFGDGSYNVSKLMEILVVRHFVSLHGSNYPIVFNTVQPGWCQSNLTTEITTSFEKKVENFMGRTTEEGARSLVFATSLGKESHGKHVGDGGLLSESFFVTSKDGSATGEKLWNQLSSKLQKIRPGVMLGL